VLFNFHLTLPTAFKELPTDFQLVLRHPVIGLSSLFGR